ncbi:hypothetical protein C0585_07720 [Candidatus Woesearchaeota archaeon]|nr:MAG: hypothetical protein C0585_07720 [Candidatus Woesearchaeota archaeon]
MDIKSKIKFLLIQAAKDKKTLTYGEVVKAVDTDKKVINYGRGPKASLFYKLLSDLSKESYSQNKILLSVLVINKQKKEPGKSFNRLAKELLNSENVYWKDELQKVYDFYSNNNKEKIIKPTKSSDVNQTETLILGVDAAWKKENPTGVALLKISNNNELSLVKFGRSFSEFLNEDPIDFLKAPNNELQSFDLFLEKTIDKFKDIKIIALDIPIWSSKIVSRRFADNEVNKYYGKKWASTHSPTEDRPGFLSVEYYKACEKFGFKYANSEFNKQRSFMEVYPHISIIEFLNLEKRLAYKVEKKNKYWKEENREVRNQKLFENLNMLRNYLSENIIDFEENIPLIKDKIHKKSYEDLLDGFVCALTCYFHYLGKTVSYGDETGKIWGIINNSSEK